MVLATITQLALLAKVRIVKGIALPSHE